MEKNRLNGKEKIKNLVCEVMKFSDLVTRNRLSIYAACTSFYIILSFIPILIIGISIIPYLSISRDVIINDLLTLFPKEYEYAIDKMIHELYRNSFKAISLSTLAVIWASSRGVLGITQGLNEIANVNESRNFVFMRIRSALFTLVLIVGLILMLVVSVFGSSIMSIVNNYIKVPDFINQIVAFKDLPILLVTFLILLYFFVALPNVRMKIRKQVLGAFLASLIWWLFSKLFSLYITTYNSYNVYGSFAILIFIGVWLYTGMYIMFMGAQLNEVIASRKGIKHER